MLNVDSAAERAARRIVREEIGEPIAAEAMGEAAERIVARLVEHVGRWVGADACRVLLARALQEVSAARPWLEPVTLAAVAPYLQNLGSRLPEQGPDEAIEALDRILTVFIEILGSAVGLELAVRLVEHAWPPNASDEEANRHDP